jgi:hypothetical protein
LIGIDLQNDFILKKSISIIFQFVIHTMTRLTGRKREWSPEQHVDRVGWLSGKSPYQTNFHHALSLAVAADKVGAFE